VVLACRQKPEKASRPRQNHHSARHEVDSRYSIPLSLSDVTAGNLSPKSSSLSSSSESLSPPHPLPTTPAPEANFLALPSCGPKPPCHSARNSPILTTRYSTTQTGLFAFVHRIDLETRVRLSLPLLAQLRIGCQCLRPCTRYECAGQGVEQRVDRPAHCRIG